MKNKRLLYVFLILASILSNIKSHAQKFEWTRHSVGPADFIKITSDPFGNVFLAGCYSSYSISFGSYTLIPPSANNYLFIVKYDKDGNIKWVKNTGRLGCPPYFGIGCDSNGNVYLSAEYGNYMSMYVGKFRLNNESSSSSPFFVAKFDSSGNEQWLKGFGGIWTHQVSDLAVTPGGDVYVTGYFNSPSFIFGKDTLSKSNDYGEFNCFLTKLDTDGNPLWGRCADKSQVLNGTCVALDRLGNITMAGDNQGTAPVVFGKDTLKPYLIGELFLVQYDKDGKQNWVRSATGRVQSHEMDIDSSGNIYVTGTFSWSHFIVGKDSVRNTKFTKTDIFVSKFSRNGVYNWTRAGGSDMNESAGGVAVTEDGKVFVSATFDSSYCSFDGKKITRPSGSAYPMVILQYDTTGHLDSSFVIKSGFGSTIHVSPTQNVFTASTFYLNPLVLSTDTMYAGTRYSLFLAKFGTPKSEIPDLTTYHIKPFNQKASLSLKTEAKDDRILVIPNPSSGKFTIKTPFVNQMAQLNIYSPEGKLLRNNKRGDGVWNIDLEGNASGTYFFVIHTLSDEYRGSIVLSY